MAAANGSSAGWMRRQARRQTGSLPLLAARRRAQGCSSSSSSRSARPAAAEARLANALIILACDVHLLCFFQPAEQIKCQQQVAGAFFARCPPRHVKFVFFPRRQLRKLVELDPNKPLASRLGAAPLERPRPVATSAGLWRPPVPERRSLATPIQSS